MTNPNPDSTPIPAEDMPLVLPRMGRGVHWSVIAREIEADELERQARQAPATELTNHPSNVQSPTENERPVLAAVAAAEDPAKNVVIQLTAEVVARDALEPPMVNRRGWLSQAIHRRLG